jgi:dynein heavy chain
VIINLEKINYLYKYSFKTFNKILDKSLTKTIQFADTDIHLNNLINSITLSFFNYIVMGLFERDKIIFAYHLLFQVLIIFHNYVLNSIFFLKILIEDDIKLDELNFLLEFPYIRNITSPIYFLNDTQWGGIKALTNIKGLENIDKEIEGSLNQWKKFFESETPELETIPQDWKNKNYFQKLCIIRAIRKDRIIFLLK